MQKLSIQNPVISNEDLDKIKHIKHPDFKAVAIPALYEVHKGVEWFRRCSNRMVIASNVK